MSVELADAAAPEAAGRSGHPVAAVDLVILAGPLGAGKTTFARGLGAGLGVRGPITSPTFVIARVHPSLIAGPDLLHVDAYRLGGPAEFAALDLEADADESVTLVEWGVGIAEDLREDRLVVELPPLRPRPDADRDRGG